MPIWVKLHGDVLMSQPDAGKLGSWRKQVKLPWPAPDRWLLRSGRQLELNDTRNGILLLVCGSDADAVCWEKALRAAAAGYTFRKAASLLRCTRQVLQVLAWGQTRSPQTPLDLVQTAFNELIKLKQLYLAFHLLCAAEQYLKMMLAGPVVLTKQWEMLRKKIDEVAKTWGTIESKDSFGVEDPFWGYEDPIDKRKVSWAPFKAVVAVRLCSGGLAMDAAAAQTSRYVARMRKLKNVAAKDTFAPKLKEHEYVAIGNRLYYEKQWEGARQSFSMAGKHGKTGLFAVHIFMLDFAPALKMALAGLHPLGLAHTSYAEGAPNVKGAFSSVSAGNF